MRTRQAIVALGSLAHETRLGIFCLLVRRGQIGLPAGEIAERLGVPAATLSFHLAHLMHARLIEQRRESRSLIYSANFAGMNALLSYLTENCCVEQAASGSADTTDFGSPDRAQPRVHRGGAGAGGRPLAPRSDTLGGIGDRHD